MNSTTQTSYGWNTAYPASIPAMDRHGNFSTIVSPGFTKREKIAIAAMQSLLSRPDLDMRTTGLPKNIAESSVELADNLLKALEKD